MKIKKKGAIGLILLILFIFSGCSYKNQDNSIAHNEKKSSQEDDISKKQAASKNVQSDTPVKQVIVNPIYNENSIPVLMYHSIMYEKDNELRMPKEMFREQMKYLKDNGYTTLTFDELYDFLHNNKPVPQKSVVITFDDGYADNYTNAYPVLKEFGQRATIFMITSVVDKDSSYLTSSELKELDANGIDIEAHTVGHDELSKLSYDAQLKTLKDSKGFLESCLNKNVKYMAYPFGKYNSSTIKAAEEAGYEMAFTTMGGWANKNNGIMTLNRVYISSKAPMSEFIYRLTHENYNKKS